MAMRCAPSEPRSRARSSPWTKPCRRPSRPCWRCWMPCPTTAPSGSSIPPQRRQRTLEALRRVLLRESQVQPLLLVCEDLHWIDSETQALLDRLSESLPTAPLLLLVNYRPEYQHGWGTKTYYTQLRLDALPAESAEELLEALLGSATELEPLKRLLIARTEGNPFFLEESIRTLLETQIIVGERGASRRACRTPRSPCSARRGVGESRQVPSPGGSQGLRLVGQQGGGGIVRASTRRAAATPRASRHHRTIHRCSIGPPQRSLGPGRI